MLSRARVLVELRAITRTRGEISVVDVRDRCSNALYEALLHHFGSIDAARDAIGARGPRSGNQRWSKEAVIAGLQQAHRRRIRLTNNGLIAAGMRGLANAARTYCGGIRRARQLAKLTEPAPLIYERIAWDEDTIISDIRALHRDGRSLASTKAPRKLVNAAGYHFGSWRDAVEVAGFDYDKVRLVRVPYERAELLQLLRKIAARAPAMTLAKLHRHSAIDAWQREFGSIEAAARAAGLRDWPRRLIHPPTTARQVIQALRVRHRDGKSLASSHVHHDDQHLHDSALRRFGAWSDALVAAGLPASAVEAATSLRHEWTESEVRDALHARKRAGRSMSPSALRSEEPRLYAAAKAHLGYNANVAIRDWGAPRLVTKWTKRMVIAALRERPDEAPTGAVALAASKLFGSMITARKAARLPLLRTAWTDERVLEEIRAMDRDKRDGTLISIAQRRFGSWRAALEAAGVPPKVRPRWTDDAIKEALQARVDKGVPLDATNLRKQDQSLFDAIRNRFGNHERTVAHFISNGRLPPNTHPLG